MNKESFAVIMFAGLITKVGIGGQTAESVRAACRKCGYGESVILYL